MKLKLTDDSEFTLPENKMGAARLLADAIVSNGHVPGQDAAIDFEKSILPVLQGKDYVGLPEVESMMEIATTMILRESVEPLEVITSIFTPVRVKHLTTQILMGAIGGVTAAADIGEGSTYPEVMFNIGGAMQTARVGKSGIACAFSDEALRFTVWDILAINLRKMRDALKRHKEMKAITQLRAIGTTLFDNLSPADSLLGVTTGRGKDMTANGSLTMEDLMKAVAHMSEEGFTPNVLLVSPMMYMVGVQDPVLRHLFLQGSNSSQYFRQWNGVTGPRDPWSNGPMGGLGPSLGNKIVPGGSPSGQEATGIAGREHGMTSAPPIPPPYFPWPLRVEISPFIPFDKDAGIGDAVLYAEGQVGYQLIDEDPVEVSWRDEATEVTKWKIRERYCFAMANEGQGVGYLKNISTKRNHWDGEVTVQLAGVDEIPSDEALDL